MKKSVLAAVAALNLGIGFAYAARTVTNQSGQVMFGPAYSSDAAGAGG